jgi:hypothetical protein
MPDVKAMDKAQAILKLDPLRVRRWRAANLERHRAYHRDYMRKWRAQKTAGSI